MIKCMDIALDVNYFVNFKFLYITQLPTNNYLSNGTNKTEKLTLCHRSFDFISISVFKFPKP